MSYTEKEPISRCTVNDGPSAGRTGGPPCVFAPKIDKTRLRTPKTIPHTVKTRWLNGKTSEIPGHPAPGGDRENTHLVEN